MSSSSCHICGASALDPATRSMSYIRVTSDCKPWHGGGELATCQTCRTVQTLITPEWRREVAQIYKNYQVYHQGGGSEQAVFSPAGTGDTRSNLLVARLAENIDLSSPGHLLDIGCGNGNFLKTFGAAFPSWKLSGAEFDAKHLADLAAIPNFQKLHTGSLERIEGGFSLVSLVHTLEHIEGPLDFLNSIRRLLLPGGAIFIQVPHYPENPFELMTADHATHFEVFTLQNLLSRSGFSPLFMSTDWVGKELSVVAAQGDGNEGDFRPPTSDLRLPHCLDWLDALLKRAERVQSVSSCFGLFGSSIAATWTAANLPRLPDFFVDEDPARVGRPHMERPILHPSQVAVDSDVFIALPEASSEYVRSRHIGKNSGRWHALAWREDPGCRRLLFHINTNSS